MENTTEIKNSMDGLNSKLDTNEKRLKSPEQNTHNFRFKKKTEKMKEKSLREMKDGMKKKIYPCPIEVHKIRKNKDTQKSKR